MHKHTLIERTGRRPPNANGYFVRNCIGATVAGPYPIGLAGRLAAWAEAARRDRKADEDEGAASHDREAH